TGGNNYGDLDEPPDRCNHQGNEEEKASVAHFQAPAKAPTNDEVNKVAVVGFGSGRFGQRQYGRKLSAWLTQCRKLLNKAEHVGKFVAMNIGE
ncbi:hypothetical protein EC973_002828, partial [Apophysomyces ossiformis]